MISRRGLIMAIAAMAMPRSGTAATGFHVRGPLTATELERQEGYVTLGKDLMLATHPKSPIYDDLMNLIGHEVRISVVPE